MLMDSASLEQLVLDTSRSGRTSMACYDFPFSTLTFISDSAPQSLVELS